MNKYSFSISAENTHSEYHFVFIVRYAERKTGEVVRVVRLKARYGWNDQLVHEHAALLLAVLNGGGVKL